MNTLELIKFALDEDIKSGDLTADLLLDQSIQSTATIFAKSKGVFCGNEIITAIEPLVTSISFSKVLTDGAIVKPNDPCVQLQGPLKTIVEIERTLLNFLQRLSGIATITHEFVHGLNDPSIQILDTRKTTPNLRDLEKKAVVAGGGFNHRFGLFDMILVKENHLHRYVNEFGLDAFNLKIKHQKQAFPDIQIEVEVSSLTTLTQLDLSFIDIIMFDNMSIDKLTPCIAYMNKKAPTVLKEVSGNISLNSISRYQGIDIDRISIGSLTHSVKALDLSLLVL